MNLELVTVGTELLLGFTVDTNGAEIAQLLAEIGVRVSRRTSVPDRPDDIRDAIESALRRAGTVIVTGGLGPTRDDITRPVAAGIYGAALEFDESVWEQIQDRFRKLGRPVSPANRTQAEVPRGAVVLPNRWGTAPGLWLEGAPGVVVLLPGVPREMRGLLKAEVLPRLASRGDVPIRSRQLRTTGIAESTLAERVSGAEEAIAPVTLAYLPGLEGVDLRLTAWDLPADDADRRLAAAADWLRERVGAYVYGEGDADLAAVVLDAARDCGLRVAVAESCTGGLIGARLTAIPGSSDVFVGGVIAYANAVKEQLLEVDSALIRTDGAVSESVARAMAEGAVSRTGADAAIAVTGIAGPVGGTDEKPVGTVWTAVSVRGETSAVRTVHVGDRDEIRTRAAQNALQLLRRRLLGD